MKSSKKFIIVTLIIGMSLFGYSQYSSVSKIGVIITENELLEQTDVGSMYNMKLEFDNPSLLMLTAGETDFVISADDEIIWEGILQSFVLPATSKITVEETFFSDSEVSYDEVPILNISGVTKYDILFTSIDVPFVYYPTEEQAREFIL